MAKRKPLNKKELREIKAVLLKSKEEILNNTKGQESFCLDKDELMDPLDEASANIEAQRELRMRNREVFYLKKINKTLERIDTDGYGCCEECAEHIGYVRLKARPTAELCIACKEENEMVENSSWKRSKSLGVALNEMR